MNISRSFLIIMSFIFSQHVFSAACPTSDTSTATGSASGTNCTVTGSASTIQLNFDDGFADATGISAVGGNGGTTVGAQRKLSFIKAAEVLADQVQSSQSILVDADFTSLSCDTSTATLGSAGASTNTGNVTPMPGAAVLNTFYPIGLINAMGNTDYQGGLSDINASFNAYIGTTGCLQGSNGWYYGYDAPASNYIGFTTVLLHEMTHGLGFASLTDASTGAKASGIDDIFSNFLYSAAASADWQVANSSNAQRAASAISSTGLLWNGANVNTQAIGVLTAGFQDNDSSSTFTSGDRVQMYAPSSIEGGSSVSHFNTAAAPNELMEPQYTEGTLSLGLALQLLKDIGWGVSVSSNTAPTITAVDDSTNEDTAKVIDISGWGSDADGDALTYTVSSCASNLTCSISGSDLTVTPDVNHNGATHNITIQVSDASASVSDSFNFVVSAVPDAPVFQASSSNAQNTNEDTAKVISISGWATDVDGGSLTYTISSCASNITCSISGTTLTLTPDANHNGATHSITLQVSDGGLTDTTTFNLAVNAQNDAPAITAVNQTTNEDTAKVVNVSSWVADIDGDSLSYSITTCPANISCSVSGVNVTLTPSANHNGATHTVTIQVSDGNGGSHSDSFNLDVTPVNDAPTISGLPDKSVAIGETQTINLSGFGADIDGDSVSYNVNSCGSSLTCSISGTILSITANSNVGSVEAVTIEIDDTNITSTDSLNVTITADANNAPTITAVDQSTTEDTPLVINISAWGNDADGDTKTYTVTSCAANITCLTNPSGTSFTMTPNSGYSGATNSITVRVTDNGAGTLYAEDTFNLTVNAAVTPPPIITVDGVNKNPNDSVNISNNDLTITTSSGSFTYALTLDGENADALLSTSGSSTTIAMPSSGQFAGDYVLTVTDTSTGLDYDYTFVRAPRLNFSANKLLANTHNQTLKIEGGAAGDVYTLSSDISDLSIPSSATASDNADSYNAATVSLNVASITSSTGVEIDVTSIYEPATSEGLSLEPARTHALTMVDENSSVLTSGTVTLNLGALGAYNISANYSTNSSGQVSIILPDDDVTYSVTASHSGYSNQTVSLFTNELSEVITMLAIANPVNISGTVTGKGGVVFDNELPQITLTLSDNSEVDISSTLLTSQSTEYHYVHDLNSADLHSIRFNHSGSESITVLLTTTTDITVNAILSPRAQVVIASSSGGGSLGLGALIGFMLLSLVRLKKSGQRCQS